MNTELKKKIADAKNMKYSINQKKNTNFDHKGQIENFVKNIGTPDGKEICLNIQLFTESEISEILQNKKEFCETKVSLKTPIAKLRKKERKFYQNIKDIPQSSVAENVKKEYLSKISDFHLLFSKWD